MEFVRVGGRGALFGQLGGWDASVTPAFIAVGEGETAEAAQEEQCEKRENESEPTTAWLAAVTRRILNFRHFSPCLAFSIGQRLGTLLAVGRYPTGRYVIFIYRKLALNRFDHPYSM
jgi:hypothetical protein